MGTAPTFRKLIFQTLVLTWSSPARRSNTFRCHVALFRSSRVFWLAGGTLFVTTPNYLGALGVYRMYVTLTGRSYSEDNESINQWMWTPLTTWSIAAARSKASEYSWSWGLRRYPAQITSSN